MKKIIISSDSTSDLPSDLVKLHNIQIVPLYIFLGNKEYRDMIDIKPDEIYKFYDDYKILPKTAAPNIGDLKEHFSKWDKNEYDIIHFTIGSSLSSSYQNAHLVSLDMDNVFVVDSCNLSCGISFLILEAVKLREQGYNIVEIHDKVINLRKQINTSFVVDSLKYLKEGGRVSTLQTVGANLLNIKPTIKVFNDKNGSMDVGKKYRGNTKKVLTKYIEDQLSNNEKIDNETIFIIHSGTEEENLIFVKEEIEKYIKFKNIYISRVGSTISSHCGYNTIGISYKNK